MKYMKDSLLNAFTEPLSKEDKISLARDAIDLLNNKAFAGAFLELERRTLNLMGKLDVSDIDNHHNLCIYMKCLISIRNYFHEFVNFAKEEHAREQHERRSVPK